MSTKNLFTPDKIFAMPDIRCDRQFFVATERNLLAQMLWNLKNSEGLSVSKMADRSEGGISASTLHDVMSEKYKSLTDDTITGLAKILRISETHVIAAFRNREFNLDEQAAEERDRLWEMYSDIPAQCKKDVLDLLTVLQNNHSLSRRRERLKGHREKVTRRKVAAAKVEDVSSRNSQIGDKPRPIPVTSLINTHERSGEAGEAAESDAAQQKQRRSSRR